MDPELSIIIVNWNGGDLLRGCVESILQKPPNASCEVIVVDNASTDGGTNWLREPATGGPQMPIRLIENEENVGFAAACNQAWRSSTAPFVFFLNPDTEVLPGAIDALMSVLRSDGRVGACAPRLLNPDGSVQPNCWSTMPIWLFTIFDNLGAYKLLPQSLRGRWLLGRHWDHDKRRLVHSFSGAAILARREMINQVGGFDESFHVYGEDAEWCMRIIRKGWSLIFEPAAEITHHGGQSATIRWADDERRLKEIEGNLEFQHRCLTPAQVAMNTLTRVVVFRVLKSRPGARENSKEYLDAVISLQVVSFKQSIRDIVTHFREVFGRAF